MHKFRFNEYSASELSAVESPFRKDVTDKWSRLGHNSEGWTEFVLDWFCEARRDENILGRRATAEGKKDGAPHDG